MNRTTLFLSNKTQALRLPKDVAFPPGVSEVTIHREGARRIVSPVGMAWAEFFDAPGVDLGERDQPDMQEREEF